VTHSTCFVSLFVESLVSRIEKKHYNVFMLQLLCVINIYSESGKGIW